MAEKELEGDELALVIDGVSYELGDLTIQECAQLEEAFDLPIQEIDMSRALAIQHLVWFAKRRKDPTFSFEDAGALPITVLNEPDLEDEENGSRPTKAKPKAKKVAS
jgi:hypothetical protein